MRPLFQREKLEKLKVLVAPTVHKRYTALPRSAPAGPISWVIFQKRQTALAEGGFYGTVSRSDKFQMFNFRIGPEATS
jgi:hypothetical protein